MHDSARTCVLACAFACTCVFVYISVCVYVCFCICVCVRASLFVIYGVFWENITFPL